MGEIDAFKAPVRGEPEAAAAERNWETQTQATEQYR